MNKHESEADVQEIMSLPKQSKERRVKLQKIVTEGNFKHNISVIKEGKGEIVVARRCGSKSATDYTACEFCKKFQTKKNLWKHTKSCAVCKE